MKIRTRILATLLGVTSLVILVAVFAVNRQRRTALIAATKEAEDVANVVGFFTRDPENRPAALAELIVKLHENLRRDVVIVDTHKLALADADPRHTGIIYIWDRGDEVRLTMKDKKPRTFLEIGTDHPLGIKQVVVPTLTASGEVSGAVILEYTPIHEELLALAEGMAVQVTLAGFTLAMAVMVIAFVLGRSVTRPLRQLTQVATGLAAGRTDLPMPGTRNDEIGELAAAFTHMVQTRQRAEDELRRTRNGLEESVARRTAELARTNEALLAENAERRRSEIELEESHKQLLATSRQAGMAEVATGILHNVGNVLNSVNVSATLVADHVRHSKSVNLARICLLFDQHKSDLGAFITTDPQGRIIPPYLGTLAEAIEAERTAVIRELELLRKNIQHIKDIVVMQQNSAKNSGFTETISVPDLIEDALRINADSLARHQIDLVRDYEAHPVLTLDKHKVLQILINLVRNAMNACDESGRPDKMITVRLTTDKKTVRIIISDNGVGIPAENLLRIFNHGFTTRKDGHGFGLHTGALAARELGGQLTVFSAGPGHGASFTLELSSQPEVLPAIP